MKAPLRPMKSIVWAVILTAALSLVHCARKGLVTEAYSPSFYKIPKRLADELIPTPSTFVVYSDNQAGWRALEVFLNKSKWTSKTMWLFPFYQVYLLGNGLVGGVNWLRHVPDYGRKERFQVRDAVYAAFHRTDAAFVLNLGDLVADDGRRPSHWAMFLKENQIRTTFLNDIPLLPVLGNHEHANDTTYGFPNYQAVFGYPRFYTVSFDGAVLIVLDSNFLIDQNRYIDDGVQDRLYEKWFVSSRNSQEASWLEIQLKNHAKDIIIIAMHHPPISFAKHHTDWFDPYYGRNLPEKRSRLLELFQQYDVRLVLSGHDHLYQHHVLRYEQNKQIHFLVVGGGGAPVRQPVKEKKQREIQANFKQMDLDVIPIKQESVHHICLVKVKSGEVQVDVQKALHPKSESNRIIDKIFIDSNPTR